MIQTLTPRQAEALDMIAALRENDGDCTVAGLAEAMEMKIPAAYQLLSALVEKKAVIAMRNGRAMTYQLPPKREAA